MYYVGYNVANSKGGQGMTTITITGEFKVDGFKIANAEHLNNRKLTRLQLKINIPQYITIEEFSVEAKE